MNRIASFIETPGGVDQGVIAANTALALAAQNGGGVLLIDLSFKGEEELTILLGEKPARSLRDLMPLLPHLNETLIKGYLSVHSGVTVLGGTEENLPVPGEHVSELLRTAAAAYPFSLVMAPPVHNDLLETIIDGSDILLLPISPHMICVNRAKTFLSRLKAWHFPIRMAKPLLCQPENVSRPLTSGNVQEHLALEPLAEITCDQETLYSAINTGIPALAAHPHGKFSGDIRKLAKALQNNAVFAGIDKSERARGLQEKISAPADPGQTGAGDDHRELKEKIHRALIAVMDIKNMDLNDINAREGLREKTRNVIQDLLSRERREIPRDERARFVEELLDEVLGLGCLEKLLKDPGITEIMVNGHGSVYIEEKGKIRLSGARFTSPKQLMTVIDRIVSPIGRRVDESSPLVDARLSDGSRVNIAIPPVSLAGPSVTIRKFPDKKLSAEDLIEFGALKPSMAGFLMTCVRLRKNIVISGGTGSGKTTLLNVVSSFIPADERIVTIEDSAELRLPQEHVVRLESRPASLEGTGEVSIRRLVINALRMRPDRIVVGECRSGETLDMLQAMNTGHDGSLTTVHANSPADAVGRIVTMAMMAGMDLPEKAIREQIVSAVQIIVQLSRLSDGSRKVVEISELYGDKNGAAALVPLFKFEQTGILEGKVSGRFIATGTVPSFIREAGTHGLAIDPAVFAKGAIA